MAGLTEGAAQAVEQSIPADRRPVRSWPQRRNSAREADSSGGRGDSMQFFTREWMNGELDDTTYEAAIPAYEAHLVRIMPLLPGTVQTLARGINIHDGLIRSVDLR